MYSYGTSVLFVCRLCKSSFQIVDDFIEHKKEKHLVEFRSTNCIVFEDILILNTSNDEDKSSGPGLLSTVTPEKEKEMPLGKSSDLAEVDPNSSDTQQIIEDPADSVGLFPIISTSDCEKDGNDGSYESTCYLQGNEVLAHDFFPEDHDLQEAVEPSQASANVSFNFIEPKKEMIESDRNQEINRAASVDSISFPENPYILLKKLSSKEIENFSPLQNNRRPYCFHCSKFFRSKWDLNLHKVRVHGTEEEKRNLYKFKCNICLKAYTSKSLLKYHVESHKPKNAQVKPFNCDQCGMSFISKGHLTGHRATHANTRPFQCPELDCEKAFKRRDHLQKHVKYIHSNILELLKCSEPNCTSTFKYKQGLVKHLKKWHTTGAIP